MKDGIIKGTGNSRYLKTVADALTRYPDWPTALQAMIEGTFPIDLNGINPAGWTQQGMELNKAHLLTDAAVSALGLSGDISPSDAFAAISTAAMLQRTINKQSARSPASGDLVSSNNGKISIANLLSYVKGQSIATGSYTGTGTYGQSNPCSLTFNFPPKFAWIYATSGIDFSGFIPTVDTFDHPFMTSSVASTEYKLHAGFYKSRSGYARYGKIVGNSLYWYDTEGYDAQMNSKSSKYFWIAFG